MVKLYKNGAYLLNGTEIVEDGSEQAAILASKLGDKYPSKEEAAKNTMAYSILSAHNTSDNMEKLKIKFDKLISQNFKVQDYFKNVIKDNNDVLLFYIPFLF